MVNSSVQACKSAQPTTFQQRVYDCVSRVPAGKVTTYRELAKALDCHSAQAIGQALRRNPYAPQVPCHRVIKTDLTLGGYAGATNGDLIDRKLQLLQQEGVKFEKTGVGSYILVDKSRLFSETND